MHYLISIQKLTLVFSRVKYIATCLRCGGILKQYLWSIYCWTCPWKDYENKLMINAFLQKSVFLKPFLDHSICILWIPAKLHFLSKLYAASTFCSLVSGLCAESKLTKLGLIKLSGTLAPTHKHHSAIRRRRFCFLAPSDTDNNLLFPLNYK